MFVDREQQGEICSFEIGRSGCRINDSLILDDRTHSLNAKYKSTFVFLSYHACVLSTEMLNFTIKLTKIQETGGKKTLLQL